MFFRSNVARCFLLFNKPRAWGCLGASADQTAQVSFSLQIGRCGSNSVKAFWELILSLLVVLVALLLASCCSSFVEVVFFLLLEPLGVDFELPN